jgi:hypothetical protein
LKDKGEGREERKKERKKEGRKEGTLKIIATWTIP